MWAEYLFKPNAVPNINEHTCDKIFKERVLTSCFEINMPQTENECSHKVIKRTINFGS